MRQHLTSVNPATLHDLKKFYPQGYQIYLSFKQDFIRGTVEANIRRGIAEGYYRQEVDAHVLAAYRVEQVEQIFDHHVFLEEGYDLMYVQMQLFEHFIFGLVTDKGRALYLQFKETEK